MQTAMQGASYLHAYAPKVVAAGYAERSADLTALTTTCRQVTPCASRLTNESLSADGESSAMRQLNSVRLITTTSMRRTADAINGSQTRAMMK